MLEQSLYRIRIKKKFSDFVLHIRERGAIFRIGAACSNEWRANELRSASQRVRKRETSVHGFRYGD